MNDMDTILITGANRGIGLELAAQYAADGWRVLACCRHPERAEPLQRLHAATSGRLSIHGLEVTDNEAIQALARELDGQDIDILFNNAGVGGGEHQALGKVDVEDWLRTFRVNTIAPLKVAEAFLPHVGRSRQRIIATMGSVMGSLAENTSGGHYIYRSAKAAVHMVGRCLAVDLRAQGIISVLFHPGWVKTDMGGANAPVAPADSAAGLRRVLAGLRLEDSGRFFDYQGDERPW
jgi:NAD(P)-dependent dehydrogenase (short-subunit alcohol dehydrogenase family)